VETALVHQHLQKDEIIAPGRVETAAAAPELTPRRGRWRCRPHRAAGLGLGCADETRLLGGGEPANGVRHPQWGKNALTEINLEGLAADCLDRPSGPVEIDAVFPAIARVEHQRQPQ